MLRQFWVSLGVIAVLAVSSNRVGGQLKSDSAALERFANLTAQERRQLVERADAKAIWHTVAKGEVIAQLVERGTLEAMQVSDIVCRVKTTDIVIKWVVDDGTVVKSGDKVLELDDASIREKLKQQKLQVELATAQNEQAKRHLALVQREGKLAEREAEADIAAAERELKAETDAAKKDAFELRLERARVALERARLTAKKQEFRAEAELREKTAVLQQEQARLKALEEDLLNCTLSAPQDGFLVYYVPEASRSAAGQSAIVAVGEPVRLGQRLLRVADLRRMALHLRVPESQISRVRKEMPASVRVDAFPKEALTGAVVSVATVASQPEWIKQDIKVYPVAIRIEGDNKRLKPGMTGEARILFERRQDVLWLPSAAIVMQGKERYCYVRDGQDALAKRTVVLGAQGEQTVEVREGLREGDQVLVNILGVSRRVDANPKN